MEMKLNVQGDPSKAPDQTETTTGKACRQCHLLCDTRRGELPTKEDACRQLPVEGQVLTSFVCQRNPQTKAPGQTRVEAKCPRCATDVACSSFVSTTNAPRSTLKS